MQLWISQPPPPRRNPIVVFAVELTFGIGLLSVIYEKEQIYIMRNKKKN